MSGAAFVVAAALLTSGRRADQQLDVGIVGLKLSRPVTGKHLARRHPPVVVHNVKPQRQSDLPQVISAGDAVRRALGPAQRRQQQSRQDGDDRNHHQEFNQRKGGAKRLLSGTAASGIALIVS